jgi:methylated-DNA-[protein]-cysteine S-methyltransferase
MKMLIPAKAKNKLSVPYIFSYETEIGLLTIIEINGEIKNLFFSNPRSFGNKPNVGEAAIATRSDGVDRPTPNEGSNNNDAYVLDSTWYGAQFMESDLLKEAHSQLKAYFKGKLREFSLPLAPDGTDFQIRVWKALCDIPYGATASYKEIATAVNNPKAYRAVGNANNKNPIPIIIPCHRVIASDGKLAGYGGGISIKEKLLKLEGVSF